MQNTGSFPNTRLRRTRNSATIRALIKDYSLDVNKLILPLFIKYGNNIKNTIHSMPGHYQLSIDNLEEEAALLHQLGINSVILFGIPQHKDALGQASYSEHGIIQQAIIALKKYAPNLLIIADICLCEYTTHGHCGVITEQKNHSEVFIDNDQSLELLALQAVSYAEAGADIIAPSANMDGMVYAIRSALDSAHYKHLPILSYAVKYASAMYGPFRMAAEGAPQFGDRCTYQMDYNNAFEAIREASLDIAEGTDMIMIKPAHTYLDIINKVKTAFPAVALGAYHTSGEFAMLKAAAINGWIDEKQAVIEVLSAIHRAGANFIISYYAKEVASWLRLD